MTATHKDGTEHVVVIKIKCHGVNCVRLDDVGNVGWEKDCMKQ